MIGASLWLGILIAAPASAQSGAQAGAPAAQPAQPLTITPAPTIAPAAAGDQIRQPPQNSAMRRSGSGGGTMPQSANPMGMAGMGGGGTNALTLSSGMGAGADAASGAGGGMGGAMPSSGPARRSSGSRSSSSRVTDTGITRRAAPR